MASFAFVRPLNLLVTLLYFAAFVIAIPPRLNVSEIKTVHQFPNETWLENLAVRSDGSILVTLLSEPEIYLVDPHDPDVPTLMYRFPNATGVLGITEVTPDVFTVAVGNWSTKTFKTMPGSYSVWSLNLQHFRKDASNIKVSKITNIPEAQFLNGMTTLNRAHGTILVADSGTGSIYRVHVTTGEYHKALQHALLEPPKKGVQLGVNGIHLFGNTLYFTNSYKQLLGEVRVSENGQAISNFTTVKKFPTLVDDFTRGEDGAFYITTDPGNELGRLEPNGRYTATRSMKETALLAGDTAAAFGRLPGDMSTLYITTNGGIVNPVNGTIRGGRLLSVTF